jgi:hypothetical protein
MSVFYFSDNVLTIPAIVEPPDLSADTTFLTGDCNNPITSPISSSLDLSLVNASKFSSPINTAESIHAAFKIGLSDFFLKSLI